MGQTQIYDRAHSVAKYRCQSFGCEAVQTVRADKGLFSDKFTIRGLVASYITGVVAVIPGETSGLFVLIGHHWELSVRAYSMACSMLMPCPSCHSLSTATLSSWARVEATARSYWIRFSGFMTALIAFSRA